MCDFLIDELPPNLIHDLLRSIADRGDAFDGKAQEAEAFREPVRVGIQREAADQLIADRHDAGGRHPVNI